MSEKRVPQRAGSLARTCDGRRSSDLAMAAVIVRNGDQGLLSTVKSYPSSLNSPSVTGRSPELVLSLFPGVDLFGRAFRECGFCVVTGPDLIIGGNVREFAGVPGRFDGVIGGPPCQDFSSARPGAAIYDGIGVAMIQEFLRIVAECEPEWFLMENVPSVPDVALDGYHVQRLDLSDAECGGRQLRRRHFQFGHRDGAIIRPERVTTLREIDVTSRRDPAVTGAPETSFAEACRRQGLPHRMRLPGWSRKLKHQAIGNGVPLPMGRTLARAVTSRAQKTDRDCRCLCGRTLTGNQKSATAACRKRLERRRRAPYPLVTLAGVTMPADRVTGPAATDLAVSDQA